MLDVCRDWQTIKNTVFKVLSHITTPPNNNLYYVETQKKTNTLGDYGQFLFAVIPSIPPSSEQKNMIITFFTICVPVDSKTRSFLDYNCPLDSCLKQMKKQGFEAYNHMLI